MRRALISLTVIALAILAAALPYAAADTVLLDALIDGAQANAGAGTGSTGTGSATMTLDTDTNLFAWDIMWSGMLGNITVAHFHGPAQPDQNAGVQINFGAISGLTSPSIGSATITDSQKADLLNELWYINIHSDRNPGGEIRGNIAVVPEPVSSILFLAGGITLGGIRFRRKRGNRTS